MAGGGGHDAAERPDASPSSAPAPVLVVVLPRPVVIRDRNPDGLVDREPGVPVVVRVPFGIISGKPCRDGVEPGRDGDLLVDVGEAGPPPRRDGRVEPPPPA